MQNIYLPLCGIEHFIDSHLNQLPWQWQENCPNESLFLPLMGHSFIKNTQSGQIPEGRGTFIPK